MNEAALRFHGVRKRFGRKTALDGLDLVVEPGSVLGLVGRNGAGKTTGLRVALGVLHADAGEVRVLGLDPVAQGRALRERVSLLAEEAQLYPWMRVGEILEFGGAIHSRWDPALARTLATRLELDRRALVRELSRGTKAKVALVLAAACRPDLLLLDDPTAGLDPLVRHEVLAGVLDAVSDEGGAVVYASHLIHDVERVADRVALLDAGRVRLEGSLEGLKLDILRVNAVFAGEVPAAAELPGQIDQRRDGRVLSVVARAGSDELTACARSLGAREVEVRPMSLEEILVAWLRHDGATEAPRA